MPDAIRVLHVDDQVNFAELTARYLEGNGDFEVTTVDSTERALAVLEAQPIDCVVSDYEMDEMDGLAFLEVVRERHGDVPFVLFTGKGNEAIASEAISAGVDNYLQKGTGDQYAVLANRIEAAVAQRRAERRATELARISDVVREISCAAVRADDRSALEATLCEKLAAADPYLFAWCGSVETETNRVVPREWAGEGEHYLDSVVVEATDRGGDPAGVAAATGRASVAATIDPDGEEWETVGADQGFRSAAGIPIAYGDRVYGVLGVYADRPDAFDENEREVLVELCDTIGHAISRMETRRCLERRERELERYETIIEESTDAVMIKDLDGRYQLVNARFEEMLDRPREEILGRTDRDLFDPAVADEIRERERAALEAESIRTYEETIPIGDDQVTFETTRIPYYDPGGDLAGTIGICRDVTERKARERELERQNERLDAFASLVSHDLQSPLDVANGFLDIARDTGAEEHFDEVEAALTRMDDIVEEMLTLARTEQGLDAVEPVDLGDAARDAWYHAVPEGSSATLDVVGETTVEADETQLSQLLKNLFRNAIEHGGPAVTVRVGPTAEGFFVADDGPGLPADERPSVFEPGYTTDEEGSGLGLSIVRRIAEAHGWDVAATAAGDGGARFEFTGVESAAVDDPGDS